MEKNDHDLLIRIDTRLEDLIKRQSDIQKEIVRLEDTKCGKEEADKKFTDFEVRLRKLERFFYGAIAVLIVLQVILGLLKDKL